MMDQPTAPVLDVFAGMNPEQQVAIAHVDGPLLVVAGAGSGKTRVITRRIVHIGRVKGLRPDRILAITFTNKAAGEMRRRVAEMVGMAPPWIGTFHSVCLRILKAEQSRLGFAEPFTVMDQDDQTRLMRKILADLGIDVSGEGGFKVGDVLGRLSKWRNDLVDPSTVETIDPLSEVAKGAWKPYVEANRAACRMDYDDLLVECVRILREDPKLASSYAERFPYVLVDEYQDTNRVQYVLLRTIASHRNICATGDPDQSIYGWRGADISNIIGFTKDYPDAKVVKLERNYRSSATILAAAQGIVEKNTTRVERASIAHKGPGRPVAVLTVTDEKAEAGAIAASVARTVAMGGRPRQCAVFYRMNAQSRAIEDAMRSRDMPYMIVGGTRFYDREEVRDLVAYIRIAVNKNDRSAVERIANRPRRGMGDGACESLFAAADAAGMAIPDLLADDAALDRIRTPRNASAITQLAGVVRRVRAARALPAGSAVAAILEATGLEAWYHGLSEDGPERAGNLREAVHGAKSHAAAEGGDLRSFLDHVTLMAGGDERVDDPDAVRLMTVHSAKGLEFPHVWIAGCEDGIMPLSSQRASVPAGRRPDPDDLEEERRLMYVACTRAEERLHVVVAERRTLQGQTLQLAPSRFIDEMPERMPVDAGGGVVRIHIDARGGTTHGERRP